MRCSTVQAYNLADMSPSGESASPRGSAGERNRGPNSLRTEQRWDVSAYTWEQRRGPRPVAKTAVAEHLESRFQPSNRKCFFFCVLHGFHRKQTKIGNTKGQLNVLLGSLTLKKEERAEIVVTTATLLHLATSAKFHVMAYHT